jgi:hypothetical protein
MSLSQYFQNELEFSLNKVIKDVYPDRQIISGLPGALQENSLDPTVKGLLPFNLSVPAYEDHFAYNVTTSAGIAEFYTLAADDVPQISRGRQKVYGKIEQIAIADSWTYADMMRDQAYGLGLITESLTDMRRAHDRKLDNVAWSGSATYGLAGFSNFPGVTTSFLPADGTGASPLLSTKTPSQMYRDLVTMGLSISSSTKNVFGASTLLINLQAYNLLSTTRISSTGDSGDTVLETFLRTQTVNPYGIKRIVPCPFLDGKGFLPGSGFAIVYNENSEYVETFISDYFRVFNSGADDAGGMMSNFKASMTTVSRTGGTVVYKPLSMNYFSGI